ncbi:lipoprotein insertase outer membrane protein LolB [Pseudoxanthomonas sp. SGNA-20]|uniref:lipoprotein insertase outer membrane protein LolB n=1 Tax=Pseudoxanthomonas sp. SGNA-20 TaxID=2493088 RepID=UPI0018F615F6|nr:lipoprotein insertase outer membrane protein LolB [Pseudoxanthomonas sp. SGNA-20]
MHARMRLAALLPLLLLAACTSTPTRTPAAAVPAAEAERQQAQRREVLEGIAAWSLQARVAISNGQKGGSGRLEWNWQDGQYRISLGAPVTRQSWSLSSLPGGGAVLEGIDGGPRQGGDASLLLREATGWEVPVQELAWWVRGLETPGADAIEYGADGRLQRMRAAGWNIEYQEWMPPAGGLPAMPRRMQAERGEARVRLVVDGWSAP